MRGTKNIATVLFSAVAFAFVPMASAAAEENARVLSTPESVGTALTPDSDPWGQSVSDSDPWG
ncbi:hypothetical protein [Nocardiopsis xinjiangensis]|uniref:hypothetical protein n=1 Tax=Nocardiopsis xinjiangensis TaxID=124285 RepID=UPI000349BD0D|nr:hypothetical protein [Nocardiopsis xinjiangensis]